MIIVLGDLIADLVLHIDRFPVNAKDLKRVEHVDLGPGGATNVAIAAARLGLQVGCLGEVGDDRYGEIVLTGLEREGIDATGVLKTPGASTPVAGVLVDEAGEPAYLGYRGTLSVSSLEDSWRSHIREAEALFVDGWADHEGVQNIILDGLRAAEGAGIPRFFDPGPGNHEYDMTWHLEATSLSTVLLLNEAEAQRLSGNAGSSRPAKELLNLGPELVIIKLGAGGCYVQTADFAGKVEGYSVEVVDTTGAGDSFDAAIIYGYLANIGIENMATLANVAGAAKVRKRGTGHSVPTIAEIFSLVEEVGGDSSGWKLERDVSEN